MSDTGADQKSLERLTTLSDGIFAIAMTLLVLDIHVTAGLDPARFRHMVHELLPEVGAYALSFTILAGIWRDHRRILQLAQRMDARAVRLTLASLGAIALVPFPTSMLSEYASQPMAVALYAGTIVVIDLLQLAVFVAIRRPPGAVRPDTGHEGRDIVTDLGATILVFAVTVPIAFVSPAAAIWTWLVQIPIKFGLARSERPGSRRARNDGKRQRLR